MASRLDWFLSPRGRQVSFAFMCTASCAAFTGQFAPHTFLINKYKEIVTMYNSGLPVPVGEKVKQRWNEVLKDLSLHPHEVKYLEPFTVFGFDMFRAGTIQSKYGAIIGIPTNFTYQDTATIDPSPIQVNNEPVNWNRNDAKDLLNSLILSERAQRYGIAREVLMVKHNEPLIRSALGAFLVSSTYLLGRGMNDKFELLKRPRAVRIMFYALGALFSFGIWAVQVDLINCYYEEEADSYIAQLGRDYKLGAVEFYEKMQKRNIALRSLLGSGGESSFTPSGNVKYFFRQPSIPIDQRKDFFVKSLAAAKESTEVVDEKPIAAQPA